MSVEERKNSAGLYADIVVMGSGGGLAAAVTAAEAGADVILIEKAGILGGYTRQANALMACESPLQKRQNINITKDDIFRKFMDWNHWHRVDPRVVRAFVNKSGETIGWLEAKGVEFDIMPNDYGLHVIHMPKDMMASVQKTLVKSAKDLGIKTFLHTSGRKILLGEGGEVRGVLAVKEGEDMEIQTGCVIIATGGFGDNVELLRKYCPDYYDGMRLDDWPNHEAHSGDGIYMAEEIGAAIADWVPIYHRGGAGMLGGRPWKPVIPMSMPQRMIWVNKKGRRFADECSCGTMEGNRAGGNALFLQHGREVYAIFGTELVQAVESGVSGFEQKPRKQAKGGGGAVLVSEQFADLTDRLKNLAEEGKVKKADSWEEIADWIGCRREVLKAEIDEYNSFCTKGHDELFSKDPAYLVPLRTTPYYGIKNTGGAVGETLGGIKVTERMEVLDNQSNVIPGVYAAGVLADGHQGQTYCYEISGCAVGFAVNSGRIAGENAGKYILGKRK